MAEKLDPKEIVTLEELAISSMWEMAVLVEVLEKKGLLTKQDILDAIRELRQVKMLKASGVSQNGPGEENGLGAGGWFQEVRGGRS